MSERLDIAAPRTRAERDAAARTAEAQREHERKVVAEHYENDPEIFSMVLDSRLTYSTGVFERADESLEAAQDRKMAYVARLLDIRPGERVFDAGCGWGSVMLYLAEHTQGSFQGVTLSSKQREELLSRAQKKGVADRVRVDLMHVDEAKLEPESLDAIVFSGSIVHMHDRAGVYARAARALKPGGRLLVSDCFFPKIARGNTESAATHYIFVTALGYCRLLSLSEELALMEDAGLDVLHTQDLTSSYAITLAHWIDNVRKNRDAIEARAPGFARILQAYMTVARLSFAKRTALEYMVLAAKGRAAVAEVPGSPFRPAP
jgi:cyclopropane-fatty-acyl-phospholipid synthase